MPTHFSMLSKTPFSAMRCLLRFAIPLPVCILAACNAYNLDEKIRSVLQPGLTISASAFSGIPFNNQGVTRNLADFTTGGTPPYTYSMSVSGTLPTYLQIAINANSFTIGRNAAVAAPASLNSLAALPNVDIRVSDSAGNTYSASIPLQVNYKRVFATKDVIYGDSAVWNTSGANDYSTCTSGDPVEKANCRCRIAATTAKLPNGLKYRAWLSSNVVDARCNLINQLNNTCGTPATNAGGPWYNMGNALVAADMGTATTAGNVGLFNPGTVSTGLSAPVQFQENGLAGTSVVWSGTTVGGIFDITSTQNCTNWSSSGTNASVGNVAQINAGGAPYWYGFGTQSCTVGATAGFYCFEAD